MCASVCEYQSVHHQKSGDGKRKLSDDVCIRDCLLFMCDAATAAASASSTIYTISSCGIRVNEKGDDNAAKCAYSKLITLRKKNGKRKVGHRNKNNGNGITGWK